MNWVEVSGMGNSLGKGFSPHELSGSFWDGKLIG